MSSSSRRYARWLWLLSALFVIRVLAQPLALAVSNPLLPRFDAWHSGVLPYPFLVFTQLLVLVWLGRTAWVFSTGAVVPSRRIGAATIVLGSVYFGTMALRLALGATVLKDARWFASPLPTVFHLVLASYLLLTGHFHLRYGASAIPAGRTAS
jgi:hypothetical protein